MTRRLLKHLAAQGLHASGADRLLGALNGGARRPLVLCYHRVVEDVRSHPWSAPAMLVSARTLETQLDWIGRHYRFVGLDELTASPAERRPLAAVTFDDGYADVYHHGFPLLKRKGIPAAVFVVTGTAGTDRLLPHDELYVLLRRIAEERGAAGLAAVLERAGAGADGPAPRGELPPVALVELSERLLGALPRHALCRVLRALGREAEVPDGLRAELRAMSWPMISELDRAGVTVGSHTRSHRCLANEPAPDVAAELAASKRTLEARLGHEVAHLSYPNGQFSAASVDAAAAAGYRYGYSICGHRYPRRPLLAIPRRVFWEGTTAGLGGGFSPAVASCQVRGVFDAARPCRWDHGCDGSEGSVALPAAPASAAEGSPRPGREAVAS